MCPTGQILPPPAPAVLCTPQLSMLENKVMQYLAKPLVSDRSRVSPSPIPSYIERYWESTIWQTTIT